MKKWLIIALIIYIAWIATNICRDIVHYINENNSKYEQYYE